MQVKRENLSDTKVKLTIALGLEELVHAKQHELQEQAKTVKVTGFRPGKAPLSIIEKQLDQNRFQADVINHAINDFYSQALEEEKIHALEQPQVEIGKFVPYTELEFTATLEIMPPIKLGDYKKIKKIIAKPTVTAKEVNDVIENLGTRSSVKEDSTDPAKNGDEVTIDFDGTDSKGKPVAGASGKGYPLTLGSSSFIPGFEEGLIGVKKGESKKLKLSFPKEYHAASLAGTKITFNVTVSNIQKVTLPKIDDKFAASVGPFKTLDDLKKDVKQQLTEQKLNEETNKVKDQIVEELVKKSKFELPELLVSDQITMLEQDFNQNLMYRGITKSEYLKQEGYKDEGDWRNKELKEQAERRVSVGMILSQVAEAEKVTVSQEEIDTQIAMYKQQYQQSAEQFDSPDMRREVGSRILTEKTVNLLFDLATKK